MGSVLDQEHVQVLGISVCGPAPLGWAHLRLDNDLLVLYGKNGAGKTRLLQAASAAASGVARDDSWGIVHLWVDPHVEQGTDPWCANLGAAMQETLDQEQERLVARAQRNELRQDEDLIYRYYEESRHDTRRLHDLTYHAIRTHDELLDGSHEPSNDDVQELALAGYFCAVASGTAEDPQWTISSGLHASMSIYSEYVAPEFEEKHRRAMAIAREAKQTGWTDQLEQAQDEIWDNIPGPPSGWYWDVPPFNACLALGRTIHPSSSAKDGREQWPRWAPVPFHTVAIIAEMPYSVPNVVADEAHASQLAVSVLLEDAPDGIELASDTETSYTDRFEEQRRKLCDKATWIYSMFSSGPRSAPAHDVGDALQLDMGVLNDWVRGHPPRWALRQLGAPELFPIDALSHAQRKWALQAINIALHQYRADGLPTLTFIDEPEEGMHRELENHLPEIFRELGKNSRSVFVCATHSSALLNSDGALFHVQKPRGHAWVNELDYDVTSGDHELERTKELLGLAAADILQLTKAFVLVEGAHDKIVLDKFIGEQLRQARARILPVGGAMQTPAAVGGDFLLNYTDAKLVLVMDNVAPQGVADIWSDCVRLAGGGDVAAAKKRLYALEHLDGWEARWMRQALETALKRGIWNRVAVAPLSKPDIICYLPADEFVKGHSWNDLIGEWRREHGRGAKDIKGWLETRYGKKISKKTLSESLEWVVPDPEIDDIAKAAGAH